MSRDKCIGCLVSGKRLKRFRKGSEWHIRRLFQKKFHFIQSIFYLVWIRKVKVVIKH